MKTIKIKYKLPNSVYEKRKLNISINGKKINSLFSEQEISLEVNLKDEISFKLDYNKTNFTVNEQTNFIVVYFDYKSEMSIVKGFNSLFRNCLSLQYLSKEEFKTFSFTKPKKIKFNKLISVFGILCFSYTGYLALIQYNLNKDSILAILLFLISLNGLILYFETLFSKLILIKSSKTRVSILAIIAILSTLALPFNLMEKSTLLILISSAFVFSSKELNESY